MRVVHPDVDRFSFVKAAHSRCAHYELPDYQGLATRDPITMIHDVTRRYRNRHNNTSDAARSLMPLSDLHCCLLPLHRHNAEALSR